MWSLSMIGWPDGAVNSKGRRVLIARGAEPESVRTCRPWLQGLPGFGNIILPKLCLPGE